MSRSFLTIETQRLSLRPLRTDDAAQIYEYASDPEVAQYTSWMVHSKLDTVIDYVTSACNSASDLPGRFSQVCSIRMLGSESVIGTIDLTQPDPGSAQIDYVIAREYWGRGLMTEAVRALSEWAFQQLPGVVRIRSSCLQRNVGSCRVLEKADFVLRRVEQRVFAGRWENRPQQLCRYERTRSALVHPDDAAAVDP